MKVIGIIGRIEKIKKRDYLVFNNKLVEIIYQNKCIPFGILLDFEKDIYKNFIDKCDGIILQGGDDTYPIDKEIVRYAYDKNIPTLGICLGCQLIGLSFNGNVDFIGSKLHKSEKDYVHKVKINKDSYLYQIIQKEEILVNSRHNDNIIKTDLDISAYSDDNIIEAIEDKNHNFFIGVQWHPESIMDENSNKLFDEFFRKVKEATN